MKFGSEKGGGAVFACLVAACVCVTPVLGQEDEWSDPAYYAGISAVQGEALKGALHDLIDDHIVQSYDSMRTVVRVLDEDPENAGHIILQYSGYSMDAAQFGNSSSSWNREHTWPQSFGADSGPANSDYHHLFPANAQVNTVRSNYAFDDLVAGTPVEEAPESTYSSGARRFEPRDADKGRVARAMFYMDTRYDASTANGDFQLSNRPEQFQNTMGVLDTLIEWNRQHAPDDRERRRNHLIHTGARYGVRVYLQGNRNPFVDYPELVDAIYTADRYVSWGSWRVENFSLAELADESISGDAADPDADRLTNLIEMSQDFDARTPTSEGLPVTVRGANASFFNFRRIHEPAQSGLTYSVEYSETPFVPESWQTFAYSENDLQVATGEHTDLVALSDAALPDPQYQRHFRLRITRSYPLGTQSSEVFDPVAAFNDNGSIFAYEPLVDAQWRFSPTFGYLIDSAYPWVYHLHHKWIAVQATDLANIWFYDASLGYVYMTRASYPYLYLPAHGWVLFLNGTDAPARWFYLTDEARWALESEL